MNKYIAYKELPPNIKTAIDYILNKHRIVFVSSMRFSIESIVKSIHHDNLYTDEIHNELFLLTFSSSRYE